MTQNLTDYCALLKELEDGYDQLLLGKSTIRVRYNDREVQYQAADRDALKNRINEVRVLCGNQQGKCNRYALN